MTPEQERHVQFLAEAFTSQLRIKYERGVNEHGGNLWDMSPLDLIDEALSENIDQFAYLSTARQKLLDQI